MTYGVYTSVFPYALLDDLDLQEVYLATKSGKPNIEIAIESFRWHIHNAKKQLDKKCILERKKQ